YPDAAGYRAELALIDRSLRAAGFAAIADEELRDALRRVDVFEFHLASLDLRQHSAVHDRVVAELLARGGVAGYLGLDEPGRRGGGAGRCAGCAPGGSRRSTIAPPCRRIPAGCCGCSASWGAPAASSGRARASATS